MAALSDALVYDEGGDWVGLYISGTLVAEGHSLAPGEILRHFSTFEEITLDMQADDWPGLPRRLGDLFAEGRPCGPLCGDTVCTECKTEPKPQTFTCITCGRRAVVPYGGSFQCRECGSAE
jgi:hypothetical protein